MNHSVLVLRVLALLCSAALLAVVSTSARTQITAPLPATYDVKPGETILSIAEKLRPPQATVNQMALALVRANVPKFQPRSDVRLPPGTTLTVPVLATILATDAATAQRVFGRLWRAEQHYAAGLALEKSKDMFFAFSSYVEAAKLGHGLAQLRLGQLYDNDFSGFVKRDLQESIRWYEKARQSNVQVRNQGPRSSGQMK